MPNDLIHFTRKPKCGSGTHILIGDNLHILDVASCLENLTKDLFSDTRV